MKTQTNNEKLYILCENFIIDHRISCREDTIKDSVSEDCYEFVEKIAEIVGYYVYDENEE